MRHKLACFASVVLLACGGTTRTGDGSGAVGGPDDSSGGFPTMDAGSIGAGGYQGGDGGIYYATGGWGGAPPSGGSPSPGGSPSGGCGPYVPPPAWPGAGGAIGGQPTCPLDEFGFATATLDELCNEVRCPSRASDLLEGLVCDQEPTSPVGTFLITGCGTETVRMAGSTLYEATFTADSSAPVALRVSRTWPSGACSADRYKAGSAPECAETTVRMCRPDSDRGAPYDGCRDPGQPGCAYCAAPWVCGDGCDVWSANSASAYYDTNSSESNVCACGTLPPCATCSTDTEQQIRTLPEKPGCDCPPIVPSGAGGAPPGFCEGWAGSPAFGAGGSGPISECDNHCAMRNFLASSCPGIIE